MPIWLGILVGVVALVAGVALGFFIAQIHDELLTKIHQLTNKC